MAKMPQKVELPENHPLRIAGFIHEIEILETFDLTWGTWERNYRTQIPGKTFPNGRWFRLESVACYFDHHLATSAANDQSANSEDEP